MCYFEATTLFLQNPKPNISKELRVQQSKYGISFAASAHILLAVFYFYCKE